MLWMARLPLLLLAIGAAVCASVPLSLAQTSKFEGTYKGTIILDVETAGFLSNASCDPTTKNFEQMMTVSGDRIYLERKAAQQNVVFSGTINAEGTASASGVQRDDRPTVQQAASVYTLTGKVDNNEFTGLISNRRCGYSVKMKK